MGKLRDLIGAGLGQTVSGVMDSVSRMSAGHLGKKELKLEIEKMMDGQADRLHGQVMAELGASERIITAELQQADLYTKRTRPMLLRRGFYLIAGDIGLRVVAAHAIAIWKIETQTPPVSELELWFMGAWAALLGGYTAFRSIEKVGNGKGGGVLGAITGMVTGNKKKEGLL